MRKILILLVFLLSIPNLVKAGGDPDYLTFTSNQDGSKIGFAKIADGATIQYNDGTGWKDASTFTSTNPLTLNSGESVQFKGKKAEKNSLTNYTQFSITGKVSASGDVNTLIDGVGGVIALMSYNYYCLFKDCSGLTDVSNLKLPSKSLASNCYNAMFQGCSSLTTAPKLPATSLASYCYYSMFEDCINLNKIEVNFTNWNGNSTYYWVDGVASTGTFICPEGLADVHSTSYIPNGWKVKHSGYLTFTANQDGSTIKFENLPDMVKLYYSTDGG